jgi:hypothetical protein
LEFGAGRQPVTVKTVTTGEPKLWLRYSQTGTDWGGGKGMMSNQILITAKLQIGKRGQEQGRLGAVHYGGEGTHCTVVPSKKKKMKMKMKEKEKEKNNEEEEKENKKKNEEEEEEEEEKKEEKKKRRRRIRRRRRRRRRRR